jgi:hypothetical protein
VKKRNSSGVDGIEATEANQEQKLGVSLFFFF